ncbi:MAG: FAD-binding oxidoreductase [Gammaproteobacteria bacterium]|nr:FAD-binding oxidoreductase [Gammaproteobacteria bacterium]
MDTQISEFQGIVGNSGILQGDDVSNRSERIWTDETVQARAIIRPRSTQQLSDVLRLCYERDQPVVIHGGLTGLVDGARTTNTDIVVSTELMNEIEFIDPIARTMTVQAGVKLQQIHEAAESEGLLFPLDLGARGSCSIGGNIATNAGGNRVIRYGMTRDMVLGLEAVLADGTIMSSMNDMIKNNAGYDLKHLFVGTEGSLGVVTRAVLRLRELPLTDEAVFMSVDEFDNLPKILKRMDQRLGGTLTSFEVMWNDYYSLICDDGTEHTPPVSINHPYYVLLEAWGGDSKLDHARMEAAVESVYQEHLISEAAIAQSSTQRNAFWAIRDDVEKCMTIKPTFVFDVSLRIGDMEAYVVEVNRRLTERFGTYRIFTFGHLGDGNLHFAINTGTDPDDQLPVERCVYEPLRSINGSISAEHGIGLEKKEFLDISRNEIEIDLMRTLKKSLDPKGILNPGKIFEFTV